jgi:hypothetical protein
MVLQSTYADTRYVPPPVRYITFLPGKHAAVCAAGS